MEEATLIILKRWLSWQSRNYLEFSLLSMQNRDAFNTEKQKLFNVLTVLQQLNTESYQKSCFFPCKTTEYYFSPFLYIKKQWLYLN